MNEWEQDQSDPNQSSMDSPGRGDPMGAETSFPAAQVSVSAPLGAAQGLLPLDVHTGDPRVDAAIADLRALDQLPIEEHPAVFTQVHRSLQDAMLTLDQD